MWVTNLSKGFPSADLLLLEGIYSTILGIPRCSLKITLREVANYPLRYFIFSAQLVDTPLMGSVVGCTALEGVS